MPHYFFHLSFGQRVVPDEEGVELPNRSAARDEARAVVRDLVNPEIGGNSRRWASWFLEVADDRGRFFRTPIGHPALQIVTPDCHAPAAEPPVDPLPALAHSDPRPARRSRGLERLGIPRAVGEPDCNKMDYPLVLEGPHKSTACDTLCRP